MGVLGFQKVLDGTVYPATGRTEFAKGTKLLIDADGLAFHLLANDPAVAAAADATRTPEKLRKAILHRLRQESRFAKRLDGTAAVLTVELDAAMESVAGDDALREEATPEHVVNAIRSAGAKCAQPIRRDHGGIYDPVVARLTYLLETFKAKELDATFFWDGAATAFKAATKEDRAESRAEEELRLYRLCEEGLEQPYQTNYPMPPMLMEQVRHTLDLLGAAQVFCAGEADRELAAASAAAATQAGPAAVVLGRDTDFCFFSGCSYLEFKNLALPTEGPASGVVVTRHGIATLLGVPEQALVEWACFVGNDYTKPLVRADGARPDDLFSLCPSTSEGNDSEDPKLISLASTDGRLAAQLLDTVNLAREIERLRQRLLKVQHRTTKLAVKTNVASAAQVAAIAPAGGSAAAASGPPAAVVLKMDIGLPPPAPLSDLLAEAIEVVDDGVDWKRNKPLGGRPIGGWCKITLGDQLGSLVLPASAPTVPNRRLLLTLAALARATQVPFDELRQELRWACSKGGRDPRGYGERVYMLSRSQIPGVEGSCVKGDTRANRELQTAEAALFLVAAAQNGLEVPKIREAYRQSRLSEAGKGYSSSGSILLGASALLADESSVEDVGGDAEGAATDASEEANGGASPPPEQAAVPSIKSVGALSRRLCGGAAAAAALPDGSEEEDGEEDPELDAAVGPEVPLQYVLYSKVPELQRALVYSRALYNLESTAKLEEEAAAAAASNDDAASADETDDESIEEKLLARAVADKVPVGLVVLNDVRYSELFVDEAQKRAIAECLAGAREERCPQSLTWDDAKCWLEFQRVCARILRCRRRGSATTSPAGADVTLYRPEDEPNALFHGPTAHTLAQRYRQQAAPKSLAPPPAQPPQQAAGKKGKKGKAAVLPIDAHEAAIIEHIRAHQVTIIMAETGAGKSTRVPDMVLQAFGDTSKIYVSQPRRVAATAIRDRLAAKLGKDKVGLRLGQGLHDVGKSARIHVCTAGWLQTLLAHNKATFGSCTHLIIDEVHERSVDTDLLCYYAKEVITLFPHIKLVLMSATVSAQLYADYYNLAPSNQPLMVGAGRYELTIHHLGDINDKAGDGGKPFPPTLKAAVDKLAKGKWALDKQPRPPDQWDLAATLARWVGRPGRSVLIFVPGMADIEDLLPRFDEVPGFEAFAIHGTLDLDQQMEALEAVEPDTVKVVIATNAAESSLTLPNCDHVICLGMRKSMVYNKDRHQQELQSTWISKASARQRAGRTGRVAPGTVWRLYPKAEIHDKMDQFDTPEILSSPIDAVLLRLMVSGGDIPAGQILTQVLDPPTADNIDAALLSLHGMRLIDDPDDLADVSQDGVLASSLGMELNVARIVVFGVRLGLGLEAACLAAVTNFSDSPFWKASPYTSTFHDNCRKVRSVMAGMEFFDQGLKSQPLMLLRILVWYRAEKRTGADCSRLALNETQVRRMDRAARAVISRLSTGKLALASINPDEPLVDFIDEPDTINKLRLLLLLAFPSQVLRGKPPRQSRGPRNVVTITGYQPTDEELFKLVKGVGAPPQRSLVSSEEYTLTMPAIPDWPGKAAAFAACDQTKSLTFRATLFPGPNAQKGSGVVTVVSADESTALKLEKLVGKGLLSGPAEPAGAGQLTFTANNLSSKNVGKLKKELASIAAKAQSSALLVAVAEEDGGDHRATVKVNSAEQALGADWLNQLFPEAEVVVTLSVSKSVLTFEVEPEPAVSPLSINVPLGCRVLGALPQYSSKELRRDNGIAVANDAEGNPLVSVLGLPPRNSWAFEAQVAGSAKQEFKATRFSGINPLFESGECKPEVIDKAGLVGMATAFMVVGKDGSTTFVDNVTLFPSPAWYDLALACANSAGPTDDAEASEISGLLSNDAALEPNLELAVRLDNLFGVHPDAASDAMADAETKIHPDLPKKTMLQLVLASIVAALEATPHRKMPIVDLQTLLFQKFGRCQVRFVVSSHLDRFINTHGSGMSVNNGEVALEWILSPSGLIDAMVECIRQKGGNRSRLTAAAMADSLIEAHGEQCVFNSLSLSVGLKRGKQHGLSPAKLVWRCASAHAKGHLVCLGNLLVLHDGVDARDLVAISTAQLNLFDEGRAPWSTVQSCIALLLNRSPQEMSALITEIVGDCEDPIKEFFVRNTQNMYYCDKGALGSELVLCSKLRPDDVVCVLKDVVHEHNGDMPVMSAWTETLRRCGAHGDHLKSTYADGAAFIKANGTSALQVSADGTIRLKGHVAVTANAIIDAVCEFVNATEHKIVAVVRIEEHLHSRFGQAAVVSQLGPVRMAEFLATRGSTSLIVSGDPPSVRVRAPLSTEDIIKTIVDTLSTHGGEQTKGQIVPLLKEAHGKRELTQAVEASGYSSLKDLVNAAGAGKVRWTDSGLVQLYVAPLDVVNALQSVLATNGGRMPALDAFKEAKGLLGARGLAKGMMKLKPRQFIETHGNETLQWLQHGIDADLLLVLEDDVVEGLDLVAELDKIIFAHGGRIRASDLFALLHETVGPAAKEAMGGMKSRAFLLSAGDGRYQWFANPRGSDEVVRLSDDQVCVAKAVKILESHGGGMSARALAVELTASSCGLLAKSVLDAMGGDVKTLVEGPGVGKLRWIADGAGSVALAVHDADPVDAAAQSDVSENSQAAPSTVAPQTESADEAPQGHTAQTVEPTPDAVADLAQKLHEQAQIHQTQIDALKELHASQMEAVSTVLQDTLAIVRRQEETIAELKAAQGQQLHVAEPDDSTEVAASPNPQQLLLSNLSGGGPFDVDASTANNAHAKSSDSANASTEEQTSGLASAEPQEKKQQSKEKAVAVNEPPKMNSKGYSCQKCGKKVKTWSLMVAHFKSTGHPKQKQKNCSVAWKEYKAALQEAAKVEQAPDESLEEASRVYSASLVSALDAGAPAKEEVFVEDGAAEDDDDDALGLVRTRSGLLGAVDQFLNPRGDE